MKRKTRIASLCFTFSFMLALLAGGQASAFAQADSSSDQYKISYNEQGDKVLIDAKENISYLKAYKSDGTEISLEEYKAYLEEAKNSPFTLDSTQGENSSKNLVVSPMAYQDLTMYYEKQKWTEAMNPRRATATTNCAGSAQPCPISVTQMLTDTESFSGSLTGGDKNYIKANASFTWSTSSSSGYSTTLYIPVGKKGYITWSPRYNFTKGDINYAYIDETGYHNIGTKYDVWGATPAKTSSGFTDGIWGLAYEIS